MDREARKIDVDIQVSSSKGALNGIAFYRLHSRAGGFGSIARSSRTGLVTRVV